MNPEETVHISKLRFDPKNARRRTERSSRMIRTSLERFGGMRSIVVDENFEVKAGNGTLEEAGQIGLENVKIVRASGNELIAVLREGLTEEQWKEYAVADNRSSDLSDWDLETLSEIHDEVGLEDWFTTEEIAAWDTPETDSESKEVFGDGAKEIDAENFNFACRCPKCGFEFDPD